MDHNELNRFWDATLKELQAVPIDAEVQAADPPGMMHEGVKTIQNHSVRMTSFEGVKIRGWYTTPIGAPPVHGFPAIVTLPGYFGIQPLPVHYVRHGYATLALYPRSQGESLQEWKIDHATRLTYHPKDRNKYYYRAAYMDCVRAVDFLCSRPEIDKNRVCVWGMSQGGGLALALGALDSRVKAIAAELAWPLNFPLSCKIESKPYGELFELLKANPGDRDEIMATLAYFDPLHLVKRIKRPVLMDAAFIDTVHPLYTIKDVFDAIECHKALHVYPDLEHGMRADFARHSLDWFDRYAHLP
ncbi:MAG: acetylxylan esterase [Pseudorhodoplanes sp.]